MEKKDVTKIQVPIKGPYIVSGSFIIIGVDGKDITPVGGKVVLCACGQSKGKPFCDGSHTK